MLKYTHKHKDSTYCTCINRKYLIWKSCFLFKSNFKLSLFVYFKFLLSTALHFTLLCLRFSVSNIFFGIYVYLIWSYHSWIKHFISLCPLIWSTEYVFSLAVRDVYILHRYSNGILWRVVYQACGMKVEFSASQNNKAKSQMKWDLTIFLHNNLMCQLSLPCSMSTMF